MTQENKTREANGRAMSKAVHWLPFAAILTLAAALRVWGIGWGLPSATHYFSYHPDESVVLGVATAMDSLHGQLLPHFYNYGSLQIYLVNFVDTLAFVFGGVNLVAALQNPADYDDWAKLLLVGRFLTVGMGVGTVWATYALGHRLFGHRAGLFAALLLAVTPLHAQHSHWLTVDVPATFWATLSLVWAARLATGDEKLLRAAILAGVFAGFAAATKYNLALAILPLAVSALVLRQPKWIAVGAASGFLAFLLACPGALLEHAKFLDDLRFEAVHVQNADDATFRNTGSGFVYHVVTNLSAGLGWPLLIFAFASIVYALFRRQRGDGLLAAFALPYYVLIGLAAVRYARYTIPLLPILCLWAGRLAADLTGLRETNLRWFTKICVGLLVALTLLSAAFVIPYSEGDERDEVLDYVNRVAPAPNRIGFAVQPWFSSPPFSPYFSAPRPGVWRRLTSPEINARIVYDGKDWDVDLLKRERPQIVVMSEFDYRDAMRLKDPAAVAYFKALHEGYSMYKFPFGMFSALDETLEELPTRGLPHDMTYSNPAYIIFERMKP